MTFDLFWVSYRHPVNRGDRPRAQMRYRRIIEHGGLELLLAATEAYKAYQDENKWYQPMQVSSYLGSPANERWRAWAPEDNSGRTMFDIVAEQAACDNHRQMQAEGIHVQMQREFERGNRGDVPTVREILDYLKSEGK